MDYEELSPRVNAVAAVVQLVTFACLLCKHGSLQLAFEDSLMKIRHVFSFLSSLTFGGGALLSLCAGLTTDTRLRSDSSCVSPFSTTVAADVTVLAFGAGVNAAIVGSTAGLGPAGPDLNPLWYSDDFRRGLYRRWSSGQRWSFHFACMLMFYLMGAIANWTLCKMCRQSGKNKHRSGKYKLLNQET